MNITKPLGIYTEFFENHKIKPVEMPEDRKLRPLAVRHPDTLAHLYWMCNEANTWRPDRREKAMRWLGFIQGCLVAMGYFTIDQVKHHSYTPPDEPDPSMCSTLYVPRTGEEG